MGGEKQVENGSVCESEILSKSSIVEKEIALLFQLFRLFYTYRSAPSEVTVLMAKENKP